MNTNQNLRRITVLSKQGGFNLLSMILVVVAVVAVIGVWTMSGQNNPTTSAEASNDVLASGLTNDAASIKTTFDTLLINGSGASAIIYSPAAADVTNSNNILNSNTGIQRPISNPNAMASTTSPSGQWIYKTTGFKGNNIGTAAGDDMVLFLPDVKLGICQKLNQRVNGSAASATPPASAVSLATWTAGVNADATANTADDFTANTTAVDVSAVAAVANWSVGCMGTTDSKYVLFRVLKAS